MKKILFLLLTICFLGSCEDYLEVNPKNVLVVKTFDDVQKLMGSYLFYYAIGDGDDLSPNTADVFGSNDDITSFIFSYYSDDLETDNYLVNSFYARNNKGPFLKSLDWDHGTQHATLWTEFYKTIGFVNTIIARVSEYASETTTDEANRVKGEAKFLRAYSLFKLLQYFSPYTNNELGIPVNLDPIAITTFDSRRKTQSEVYDIITSELEEILNYTTIPSSSYNVFYDKELINALLAKVYHYKGGSGAAETDDYTNAVNYGKAAIENKQITAIADFNNLFDFNDYGINKGFNYCLLVYAPKGYSSNGGLQNIVGSNWQTVEMRDELFNLFSNEDIRKTEFASGASKIVTKFSNVRRYNVIHFFRVAELQLIIAESYARMGGEEANAIAYLEGLQSNRINPYTGYAGTDLLQEILDERRRELCFEHDIRWTDLARLQTGWTRMALDLTETGQMHEITDGDYRFTMPIPVNEERQYNNIEQNPGWTNY